MKKLSTKILINGEPLNQAQAELIELALTSMEAEFSLDPKSLGDSPQEIALTQVYLQTCREILGIIEHVNLSPISEKKVITGDFGKNKK